MAAALDVGGWLHLDGHERLARIAVDIEHGAHRVARRKTPADTGAHQHITLLDIHGGRHITQVEAPEVTDALGDRPHAVANDLYRQRMGIVGEQQHLAAG